MFPEGRRIDTLLTADLDGNGRDEYVVMSVGADTLRPGTCRADLLQIYSYDPTLNAYTLRLADSVAWASSYAVRDIDGDGRPELIVMTYAGGNDLVASGGIVIYTGGDGRIRPMFHAMSGDPQLAHVEGVRGEALLVHDELWPSFAAHADAVEYLDDILAPRQGTFVSIRKEQRGRFVAQANQHLEEYRTLRPQFMADTLAPADSAWRAADSSFDGPHPLFRPAALAIISFGRGGEIGSLRSFWSSEKEYLRRRLPSVQYRELETLYAIPFAS
ncbi:MAG: VCBS repeat-containing protein [Bacteroidota bacterium]